MKIQFLVSTMNKKEYSFLKNIFQDKLINEVNAIVINQCIDFIPTEPLIKFSDKITIYNIHDRGLSKSRNLALYYADADVCVLSDDDFVYLPDCIDKIIGAYKKLPQADIIIFQSLALETNKKRKNYRENIFKYNLFQLSSISSSDITFKLSSIKNLNINFDENFGLGTKNYAGEEGIFLADAFRKGLHIYHYPSYILKTTLASTGNNLIYDPFLRGKIYKKLFIKICYYYPVLIYASIKNYKNYKFKYNLLEYFKEMIHGAKSI